MGGANAYKNGHLFESQVYNLLQACNIKVIRDIPYPSIYSAFAHKHKTNMEFRAENIKLSYRTSGSKVSFKKFNTANIECKYQKINGSIDEKYPYVYSNSIISDAETTLFIYQDPSRVIKKGALDYLHNCEIRSNGRFIVKTYEELFLDLCTYYPRSRSKLESCIKDNYIENGDIKFLQQAIPSKKSTNFDQIDEFYKREMPQIYDLYNDNTEMSFEDIPFAEITSRLDKFTKIMRTKFNKSMNNQYFSTTYEKYVDLQIEIYNFYFDNGEKIIKSEEFQKYRMEQNKLRENLTYLSE